MPKRRPDAHSLAAEIIRRHTGFHVVRLSDPPKPSEQLQLIAARLSRTPIAIMPHQCRDLDEWLERHGELKIAGIPHLDGAHGAAATAERARDIAGQHRANDCG